MYFVSLASSAQTLLVCIASKLLFFLLFLNYCFSSCFSFSFKKINKGQILTRVGPQSKNRSRWIPWWSRASILIPTTSLLWGPWIRMVPALEVSPAAPSELPVSTAAPLKDRQADRHSCLAGLASWGPNWPSFLTSHSRAACSGGVLSLSFCGFLSPSEVRGSQQGQALLCTGGQQKVYFCIILREFEVSFLSWAQKRLHTKTMHSLPSPIPFSFYKKMDLALNHRRKNTDPRLIRVSLHQEIKDAQVKSVTLKDGQGGFKLASRLMCSWGSRQWHRLLNTSLGGLGKTWASPSHHLEGLWKVRVWLWSGV